MKIGKLDPAEGASYSKKNGAVYGQKQQKNREAGARYRKRRAATDREAKIAARRTVRNAKSAAVVLRDKGRYHCEECNKRYTVKKSLTKHLKVHHA